MEPAPAPIDRGADPRLVITPLDADKVEKLLSELGILESWHHVVEGLRSGFPMGIDTPLTSTHVFPNHNSCDQNPSFISAYIAGEVAAGRYSKPFDPATLESIIGHFRTSPLGLVVTTKPRMIQDLSYPRNHPTITSINSSINSDDFPTAWGTFDSTAALILSLPDGCKAATFDIKAAYRITPWRPELQNYVCVMWDGMVYVDRAACFGCASSAGVYGSIADMLVAIYKKIGFGPIRKWVDDFLAICLPSDSWTEDEFMAISEKLGIPWNREKLRRFAEVQRYIGYDWDLRRRSVSLPAEKLERMKVLLDEWIVVNPRKVTIQDTLRLHGKLVHLSSIFRVIRPFLRSLPEFANSFPSPNSKRAPLPSVRGDLGWIRNMLEILPNELPLRSPEPVDIGWWGDASTSFGVAVVVGNFYAAWSWAPGFRVGAKEEVDINWAEAICIDLGLMLGLQSGTISVEKDVGRRFLVRSDSQTAVHVFTKGRGRNRFTNDVVKRVFDSMARLNISVFAAHVPGVVNIADALSRGDEQSFTTKFPGARRFPVVLPDFYNAILMPVY